MVGGNPREEGLPWKDLNIYRCGVPATIECTKDGQKRNVIDSDKNATTLRTV